MSKAAVFLDRDGVLNRARVVGGKPYPPESVEAFELCDGVPEGLARLRAAGYLLIVVTNQPDIARKAQGLEVVEAMHRKLLSLVQLDSIRVCPHDSKDHCQCRKPRPGMILDAAREFGVDLRASFMVGDRWRDVEAGEAAGVRTVFLDYGYDEKVSMTPWRTVSDFTGAVAAVLADDSGRARRQLGERER